MRNKSALISGILAGITSPATIGSTGNYPIPKGTDLQRIRGDVSRVGGDFVSVIRRENGKQTTSTPGAR